MRYREIWSIAWPLVIANSFWNLQLTIDRLFLADYSTAAMGAAVAVMGVFWTAMALLQQTASYVMTFVAQYHGASRHREIGPAVWQSIYLSIGGGLLLLAFNPLVPGLFSVIGHDPSLQALEVDYYLSISYSALPTALVAAASGFFTGLGNITVIMKINGVGLVANAFLDYVIIPGNLGFPAMGIAGAGYATTLANIIAAIYALALTFRYDRGQYGLWTAWKPQAGLMLRFLRYGLPSGAQWALEGLAFTVFLIIVGRMPDGSAALAASSIAVTILMLAILPVLGIAQAVSVPVGQHPGEKNPLEAERATKLGSQMGLWYVVSISVTFVLVPGFYLNWFQNKSDPVFWNQVSEIARVLLLFTAAYTSFDSQNIVYSFAIKGAGDTRFVTMVALGLPWPLMVLPTYLMSDWQNAVYWAWGATLIYIGTQMTIFLWRFAAGKWKTMSVIGPESSGGVPED